MNLKFPFVIDSKRPERVLRPLIPITLIGPVDAHRARFALVDSGADLTLFRYDEMDVVKPVDLEDDPQLTINHRGKIIAVTVGKVELELSQGGQVWRWPSTVGFVPELPYPLLGHVGFLQFFTATFHSGAPTPSLELAKGPKFPH